MFSARLTDVEPDEEVELDPEPAVTGPTDELDLAERAALVAVTVIALFCSPHPASAKAHRAIDVNVLNTRNRADLRSADRPILPSPFVLLAKRPPASESTERWPESQPCADSRYFAMVMDLSTRSETDTAFIIMRLYEVSGTPLLGTSALDFGCGKGEAVRALAAIGVDAYGCDFSSELGQGDRLAPIGNPYRLPYPDAMFDAVLSWEVFEHVQDYTEAFREIRRVLRPGGTSIHTFPSRYRLLEPHVFTPLGTIIQSRPWLLFWASLGVRNRFQRGMEPAEVASVNHRYLIEQTNYLRRGEILRLAREVFPGARFLLSERLEASRRLKKWAWSRTAALVYGELQSRTLLLPG